MKLKKVLIYIFIFIVLLGFQQEVFAAQFKCEALGDDIYIDYQLAKIVRYVILLIQIAVPILLVVLGSIDLVKGVIAQKEDEMASSRKIFVKRLVSGVLIFFVIAVVKLLISAVSTGNGKDIMTCVNCFIEEQNPNDMSC